MSDRKSPLDCSNDPHSSDPMEVGPARSSTAGGEVITSSPAAGASRRERPAWTSGRIHQLRVRPELHRASDGHLHWRDA